MNTFFYRTGTKRILPVIWIWLVMSVDTFAQYQGTWQDHLPYNRCIAVAEAHSSIYCTSASSVFWFDKSDNSLNRLNKVNGLSDIGISDIAYSTDYNTLIVAYVNANLDLVKGGQVINIPDIKRKQILGNKTISGILVSGKYVYLSCGFGIVVVDMDREEVSDTWYVGMTDPAPNVNALAYNDTDNMYYAATSSGVYRGLKSAQLSYGANWTRVSPGRNYNLAAALSGKVYANFTPPVPSYGQDTLFVYDGATWNLFDNGNFATRFDLNVSHNRLMVSNYLACDIFKPDGSRESHLYTYNPGTMYPHSSLIDSEGNTWIADRESGLWKIWNTWNSQQYLVNGPASDKVFALAAGKGSIWSADGSRDKSYANNYFAAEYSFYINGTWKSINAANTPAIEPLRDVVCPIPDPLDGTHAYLGTWGYGLIEHSGGSFKQIYIKQNSSLQSPPSFQSWVAAGGGAFDSHHQLWVTNSLAPNILSVFKTDGTWRSINLGAANSGIDASSVVLDQADNKWIILRQHALLAFNENNTLESTSDDKILKLTGGEGLGNLPGSVINCLAVDNEGTLWIGSDQGVSVIYSPENIFNSSFYDAQPVMVELNGYLYQLLASESVTAIAVNGDNQKWFGTSRSGVYLMSADGASEVYHFTETNSPLLSNSITSIAVADDGNVFIGTDKGIVAFKDNKLPAKQTLDSLVIYPSPVRENYHGPIYIKNLVNKSDVKITDIAGNLLYETRSEGGQVIWDGNSLDRRRAHTGVYLVFVTNPDGSQKKVGKIMFIN